MASKKTDPIDPQCLEYAQQHTIMLLLLLLFFGILIVPRFYEQIQFASHKKTDGVIKTIYYSQYAPVLSFVEITYKKGDKDVSVKELLHQHVQTGDPIEIYLGENNTIHFQKPSIVVASLFLSAYFIVLALCLYRLYTFFRIKK